MNYLLKDNCRLCESKNINKAFSLCPTPPANAFVTKDNIGVEQQYYRLEVF